MAESLFNTDLNIQGSLKVSNMVNQTGNYVTRTSDGVLSFRTPAQVADDLGINSNFVKKTGDEMSGYITFANNGLSAGGFHRNVSNFTGGGWAGDFLKTTGSNNIITLGSYGNMSNVDYMFIGDGSDPYATTSIKASTGKVNIGNYADSRFYNSSILTIGDRFDRMYESNWTNLSSANMITLRGSNGNFGFASSVDANTGDTWMQAMRFDSSTLYNLNLNPIGGIVTIRKDAPATEVNVNTDSLRTYGNTTNYGAENNYVKTYVVNGSINTIVAGHEHKWFDNYFKVGLRRGNSSDTVGYSWEFNDAEIANISPNGDARFKSLSGTSNRLLGVSNNGTLQIAPLNQSGTGVVVKSVDMVGTGITVTKGDVAIEDIPNLQNTLNSKMSRDMQNISMTSDAQKEYVRIYLDIPSKDSIFYETEWNGFYLEYKNEIGGYITNTPFDGVVTNEFISSAMTSTQQEDFRTRIGVTAGGSTQPTYFKIVQSGSNDTINALNYNRYLVDCTAVTSDAFRLLQNGVLHGQELLIMGSIDGVSEITVGGNIHRPSGDVDEIKIDEGKGVRLYWNQDINMWDCYEQMYLI